MKTILSYFLFACFILSSSVGKAQPGLVREYAATTYVTDSIGLYVQDSTYYMYGGSRSGLPVFKDVGWQYVGKYDTCYSVYKLYRDDKYGWARNIDTFDSHGNLVYYLSQLYDTAAGEWKSYVQIAYSYDVHNNQISSVEQDMDVTTATLKNKSHRGSTYDANNNILTDTSANWSGSAWVYSMLNIYKYDPLNNLTGSLQKLYSGGAWNNISKFTYFLNAVNKPDSVIVSVPSASIWKNGSKNTYTYDAANNELSDTSYTWKDVSSVWHKSALHTYTYAGGDKLSDEYRQEMTGDTVLKNNTYTSYTYDANHNMLIYLFQTWDTAAGLYADYLRSDNSYNADNVPDTTTVLMKKSAAWIMSYRVLYYYTAPSAVKNIVDNGGDMHLYPSPANGYMNVDIKWKTAQAARLAIYDMNGRLCRQWTADASLNYHSNIPTANLPAGNYILKVQGDAGQVARQFSVVH